MSVGKIQLSSYTAFVLWGLLLRLQIVDPVLQPVCCLVFPVARYRFVLLVWNSFCGLVSCHLTALFLGCTYLCTSVFFCDLQSWFWSLGLLIAEAEERGQVRSGKAISGLSATRSIITCILVGA